MSTPDALERLRVLQAARGTHAPPKTPPTVIPWRLIFDRAGESHYEYDEDLVALALASPDDYVIARAGKVLFPEPAPARTREPTFGELLAQA